jgi:4-hydroxybenzoate polyprenyltransferase
VIRRLRLLVVLARPAALVLFAMCAALGTASAGAADDHLLLARVLVAVFAFVLCSVAVNDLADERIDRVNLAGDPRRPLASGTGSRRELMTIATSAAVVALATGAWLGRSVLVVITVGLLLSVGYSLPPTRIADRGAVASLLLPACYVGVPFLAGYLATGVPLGRSALALLAGVYLGFIGRLLVKDFRDVRGDAMFGKRTFLVRYGRRWTCCAAAIAWTTGSLVLVVGRSVAFAATTLALTGLTVALLRALARDAGPRRDERLIAASAILGRGVLLALLTDLGMHQVHWPASGSALLLSALAASTLGAALDMLGHGPRSGIALSASGKMRRWSTGRGLPASSGVPTPASRR